MLNETIALFAFALLAQAATASAAVWAFFVAGERRWIWLCLVATSVLYGLRSAIPFWTALSVGLYDYRDGLLAALSSIFGLVAVLGLAWRRR